jgi:small subunit ribosomal protein S18
MKKGSSGRSTGRGKYRSDFSGDQTFDYKDASSLGRFVSDGGKITPARISKLSIAQQKQVAAAVKKARSLGLLPNGSDAYDHFGRPEPISPVPFEV